MQMLLCVRGKNGGRERGEQKKPILHGFIHHFIWHFYNKSVQNWEFAIPLSANNSLGEVRRTRSCFHYIYSYLCLAVCTSTRMRTYAVLCKETARNVKMTPGAHAKGVTDSQRFHLLY